MSAGARPDAEGASIQLPVSIRPDDVLHFLGYGEGKRPAERIGRMIDDSIVAGRELVEARGVFVSHPMERSREIGLEPLDAAALVVGLVTIGLPLERHAGELMSSGQATRALLMDAVGSAAVEEAADRLGAMVGYAGVTDEALPAGRVSCRVSPGYGGWPIQSQQSLFAILPHRAAGVALLPSLMMVPRKSISFAMWMGADHRPLAGLSGCSRCELEQCRYRK
jgi:hypothetical protein